MLFALTLGFEFQRWRFLRIPTYVWPLGLGQIFVLSNNYNTTDTYQNNRFRWLDFGEDIFLKKRTFASEFPEQFENRMDFISLKTLKELHQTNIFVKQTTMSSK